MYDAGLQEGVDVTSPLPPETRLALSRFRSASGQSSNEFKTQTKETPLRQKLLAAVSNLRQIKEIWAAVTTRMFSRRYDKNFLGVVATKVLSRCYDRMTKIFSYQDQIQNKA